MTQKKDASPITFSKSVQLRTEIGENSSGETREESVFRVNSLFSRDLHLKRQLTKEEEEDQLIQRKNWHIFDFVRLTDDVVRFVLVPCSIYGDGEFGYTQIRSMLYANTHKDANNTQTHVQAHATHHNSRGLLHEYVRRRGKSRKYWKYVSLKWVKTKTASQLGQLTRLHIHWYCRYCMKTEEKRLFNIIKIGCGGDLFKFADLYFCSSLSRIHWMQTTAAAAASVAHSDFFMINFGVINSKCIKLKGESLNHSHEKVEKIIPHVTLNVFMICWSFVISSANFSLFFRMGNVSHVKSSTNLGNGLPAQLSVFKRISDNSASPNLFFFLSHFMRDSKKWKEKAAAWQEIRYSLVSFSFFVKSYKSSR